MCETCDETFEQYWKFHWTAMLARAMGDFSLDREEARLYRVYLDQSDVCEKEDEWEERCI